MVNKYDIEAAKIINDFLPERVFDAHMHISHLRDGFDAYYRDMKLYMGEREVLCNGIVFPDMELADYREHKKSVAFLCDELEKHPSNVGEVIVFPWDTAEDIASRIVHNRIRGLKCYHSYAKRDNTVYADIGEYLPDVAWQVANEMKLPITLHLVKDEALSHPDNLDYIIKMAKRYPDATLVLAHGGRAFAAWTVFGAVDRLVPFENIWFDFSALCESPAMLYVLKKVGISRCMWGSDYPINSPGKAISIADSFYWIDGEDLQRFAEKMNCHSWMVLTEELMAIREAAILAELGAGEIEDLFFNNAAKLFCC